MTYSYSTPLRGVEPVGKLEAGAPPSSYAVAGVLTGESGAVWKTVGLTALRGIFIAPGLWLTGKFMDVKGLTGWKLVGASLLASLGITLGMLVWYGLFKGIGTSFAQQQPLPTTNTVPASP